MSINAIPHKETGDQFHATEVNILVETIKNLASGAITPISITLAALSAKKTAGTLIPEATYIITDSEALVKASAANKFYPNVFYFDGFTSTGIKALIGASTFLSYPNLGTPDGINLIHLALLDEYGRFVRSDIRTSDLATSTMLNAISSLIEDVDIRVDDIEEDLLDHLNDHTRHISNIERSNWNNKANLPNELLTGGELSITDNDVEIEASSWRINATVYSSTEVTEFPDIENSEEGKQRYILFVGDTNGLILKEEGEEGVIAQLPEKPADTALIKWITVGFGGIVGSGGDLSGFALKADLGEKSDLTTTNKNSFTEAINEIDATVKNINQDNIVIQAFKYSNYR
jgi:hypothetical protein